MSARIEKRTERLRSRHVGHDVLVARWGWWGQPVLLFPTAGGDAEEGERFLMTKVLAPLLEAGRIKVYSCDSVGGRALTQRSEHAAGYFPRIQNQFDRFLIDEMIPWIRWDCRSQEIEVIAAGASIGAYNAVAAVCRHPQVFRTAVGMSGTYDLSKWMSRGDMNSDFYHSSPVHFVPNLPDAEHLKKLRTRFVLLATGEGDYEDPPQSWRVAHVLGAKGVPNRVDLWGTKYRHDWVTWREMLPKYLAELT